MKLLSACEIKKIVLGVVLSDGHIDVKNRLDFYSKHEEYAKFVYDVVRQISGMNVSVRTKHDKRGYTGYRVMTGSHVYWAKMRKYIYNGRKELNRYNVSRVDSLTLAQIWMCDGYLEHAKNRKINKVQNIGWFCYEAFPEEELNLLRQHMLECWGIESSLVKKPWGFGNRIRVGGGNLQKLVSVVYPYILPCFSYKTPLFYKSKGSADMSLPSAEQYIFEYECIEDIVRHSQK